ncbi:hypothetical protein Kisp01_01640 [Kineosporia sp. NBRC 101677]|nr:hypothetical protein Kisp01_01640 [Kineosporia sp. NBRC 101677]
MSYEFMLLIRTPAQRPLEDSLAQVAELLGGSVEVGENDIPSVHVDKLLVNAVEPDEVDRETALNTFALDSNLTLIFEDLSRSGDETMIRVHRSMMKAVLGMSGNTSQGVLLEEHYDLDAIVLEFRDGLVTLNQDWDGWEQWPEVLEVFPEPRTFAHLSAQG